MANIKVRPDGKFYRHSYYERGPGDFLESHERDKLSPTAAQEAALDKIMSGHFHIIVNEDGELVFELRGR